MGHGFPTQSEVYDCTNITKNYYPDSKYRNFMATDKQKVCKNQCIYKN